MGPNTIGLSNRAMKTPRFVCCCPMTPDNCVGVLERLWNVPLTFLNSRILKTDSSKSCWKYTIEWVCACQKNNRAVRTQCACWKFSSLAYLWRHRSRNRIIFLPAWSCLLVSKLLLKQNDQHEWFCTNQTFLEEKKKSTCKNCCYDSRVSERFSFKSYKEPTHKSLWYG